MHMVRIHAYDGPTSRSQTCLCLLSFIRGGLWRPSRGGKRCRTPLVIGMAILWQWDALFPCHDRKVGAIRIALIQPIVYSFVFLDRFCPLPTTTHKTRTKFRRLKRTQWSSEPIERKATVWKWENCQIEKQHEHRCSSRTKKCHVHPWHHKMSREHESSLNWQCFVTDIKDVLDCEMPWVVNEPEQQTHSQQQSVRFATTPFQEQCQDWTPTYSHS